MPSHCCFSLSLIGQEAYYGRACDLSGACTAPLILGQSPVGGEGNGVSSWLQGHGLTEHSGDTCSLCVVRKLNFFLFCLLAWLSKTSGPAGKKERLQTSCKVSSVFLVEMLPRQLTTSLRCTELPECPPGDNFLPLIKWPKLWQLLVCDPTLLSLFRQTIIYLTVVALWNFLLRCYRSFSRSDFDLPLPWCLSQKLSLFSLPFLEVQDTI